RQIELRRAYADAHLGEAVPGFLEHLGGVQQRLRRDAADVETGAAMGGALLDHADLHAELCRADRADIAAGAGSDDDEIVSHEIILSSFQATVRRMSRRDQMDQECGRTACPTSRP